MALYPHIGSVAEHIHSRVDGITTTISGIMVEIVNTARIDLENRTWQTVGSPDFNEKFLPSLINLSLSNLAGTMQSLGVDSTGVRIGDFQINNGQGSNLNAAVTYFEMQATKSIKSLGRKGSHFKANG